ncbi:LINE-1 retrotransposable element ORF2 protein [Bienertia sinuspersici]
MLHCVIKPSSGLTEFYSTFVYAFNGAASREYLWQDFYQLHLRQKGPCVLIGDLNVVMNSEEKIGSNVKNSKIQPIRQCMETCELHDIPYGGNFYTWCNKQEAEHRVYSKLDRVMSNDCWLEVKFKANALFLPEAISDHSPAISRVDNNIGGGHIPFKYFRMWSSADDFNGRIVTAWAREVIGTSMYCLTKKLKRVKGTLIELNKKGFCEMQAVGHKALQALNKAQTYLQQNLLNKELIMVERKATQDYLNKNKVYMQFLRQKAKCNWIKEGDENTAMFHRSIKQRDFRITFMLSRMDREIWLIHLNKWQQHSWNTIRPCWGSKNVKDKNLTSILLS